VESDFEITQRVLVPTLVSVCDWLRCLGEEAKSDRWDEAERVLFELEEVVGRLQRGEPIDQTRLTSFFAPTGVVQDVALESGWGDDFLGLAEQFDLAAGLLGWE